MTRSGAAGAFALAIAIMASPAFAQEKPESPKTGVRSAPNKDRSITEPQRSPQSRASTCLVGPTVACELSGQFVVGETCACEAQGKRLPGKAQ